MRRASTAAAAAGCLVVAVGAALALADRLGVRYLAQHVAQDYGISDLALAFVVGLVIWTCGHAALLVGRTGSMPRTDLAVLTLTVVVLAYVYRPVSEEEWYGFAYLTSSPPHWGRDVALLTGAFLAGLALPTVMATRRAGQARRAAG